MFLELLLCCVGLAVYWIYRFNEKRKRENIPYLPYKFPYSQLEKVIKKQKSIGMAINEYYWDVTDEPLLGIYLILKRIVLVRDPEIVKALMTTHYEYFSDRGMTPDKVRDPLSSNLFSLDHDEWRALRTKLTPAFSSGKLKQMFSLISDKSEKLHHHMENLLKDRKSVEVLTKDLSARYVVDMIGSTIFGIEVDSLTNPDHEFRLLGKNLSNSRAESVFPLLQLAIGLFWPQLNYFLGVRSLPDYISDYFLNLVNTTIAHRGKTAENRHDVLEMLIRLRNTGSVDQKDDNSALKTADNRMTLEECASNSFLFYVAGSESSSSTMCFCLFELSREPQHMKTLQDEIDTVLAKYNGQATYEALKEMKFLEKCILETIRKYPALPMLNRRCTKDFPVPGTNKIIFKGQSIMIPIRAIQTDPKNFPNPLKFNPNRCDPTDPDYSPVQYQAFGEGPKSCIGKLEIKFAT